MGTAAKALLRLAHDKVSSPAKVPKWWFVDIDMNTQPRITLELHRVYDITFETFHAGDVYLCLLLPLCICKCACLNALMCACYCMRERVLVRVLLVVRACTCACACVHVLAYAFILMKKN